MLNPYTTGNYINNFDPLYDIILQLYSSNNLLSYYAKFLLLIKNTKLR